MDKSSEPKPSGTRRVGYRQPPEQTRFKPGASGNPHGRPRGTLNIVTVLERTLRERVVISEGGRRKKVSKLEAAIKQLINKATAGELKAVQLLAALVRSAEERAVETTAPSSDLTEADKKVLQRILERMATATFPNQGGTNDPDSK